MSLNKKETKHDTFIKINLNIDFEELKSAINGINKEEYDEILIEGSGDGYDGYDSFDLIGIKYETDEEYNTRLMNYAEQKKKRELEKLEKKKNEKSNKLKKLLEDKIKIDKMIQVLQSENKNV
jgi:hypothetical protein